MAKDKSKINKNAISKLMDITQASFKKLYQNTYMTNDTNKDDLSVLQTKITNSIDNLTDGTVDDLGTDNISQLYSRLASANNIEINPKAGSIEEMFNDQSITDGLMAEFAANKYIREYDDEIDLICKYMTSLDDALDAKKDNVLSADHFSKDFINVVNRTNVNDSVNFNNRISNLKEKYDLITKFEQYYDKTARYGEAFVYHIPYNEAITRLYNARTSNSSVVTESFNCNDIIKESCNDNLFDTDFKFDCDIQLELNLSGSINDFSKTNSTLHSIMEKTNFSKTIDDSIDLEGLEDSKSKGADGFVDLEKSKKSENFKDIPGCVLKLLDRANVIPFYVDDVNLGYYYLEVFNNAKDIFNTDKSSTLLDNMASVNMAKSQSSINSSTSQDNMLRQISTKISKFIDAKFIKANHDLRGEIYSILKCNDIFNEGDKSNIKISFIKPEYITHMKFTEDLSTHRGISDLDKSLIPAKLYIALYATNTIGILTRSQDKRVYYVKQNVDTNISKLLLNTINQIKKSNFGTRAPSNVKNFLNMAGRYNDYIIPLSPSGDSPMNFEIMQGQDIDTKQDLLDTFEQMAINRTEVPYECIQSRKNVDYAIRLTMSSGKFLRTTFKRQTKVEKFFTRIINILYNCEYCTNEQLEVHLPPPAFLDILNTNQMLDNMNQYVEALIDMEMPNCENQNLVNKFKSKLKRHYLSTYVDTRTIDTLRQEAEMEVNQESTGKEE